MEREAEVEVMEWRVMLEGGPLGTARGMGMGLWDMVVMEKNNTIFCSRGTSYLGNFRTKWVGGGGGDMVVMEKNNTIFCSRGTSYLGNFRTKFHEIKCKLNFGQERFI